MTRQYVVRIGSGLRDKAMRWNRAKLTFVDVRRVSLLSRLATLLLVTRRGGGGLLASFLLFGSGGFSSRGLAASGGLLLSSFGRHF